MVLTMELTRKKYSCAEGLCSSPASYLSLKGSVCLKPDYKVNVRGLTQTCAAASPPGFWLWGRFCILGKGLFQMHGGGRAPRRPRRCSPGCARCWSRSGSPGGGEEASVHLFSRRWQSSEATFVASEWAQGWVCNTVSAARGGGRKCVITAQRFPLCFPFQADRTPANASRGYIVQVGSILFHSKVTLSGSGLLLCRGLPCSCFTLYSECVSVRDSTPTLLLNGLFTAAVNPFHSSSFSLLGTMHSFPCRFMVLVMTMSALWGTQIGSEPYPVSGPKGLQW